MTKFFRVGGCVRDKILGLKSKDIDFAVEAESFDAMRSAILARGGKIFLETPAFLTIRANVPDLGAADFVLCRKDSATSADGRRPDSVSIGTIFDDLARRDFTMNAIAEGEDGIIIDPHHGAAAIASKAIRCVGNPIDRFKEDKLRIFRALRFSLTKSFAIDGDTVHAMRQFSHEDFAGVSTERIREELLKMFAADSFASFKSIFLTFPEIGIVVMERGLWFKPTTEKA